VDVGSYLYRESVLKNILNENRREGWRPFYSAGIIEELNAPPTT